MGKNSAIEWTDHTFNGVRGCVEVSPACANCYARELAPRNPKTLGTWGTLADGGHRVVAAESYWKEPEKWNRWARFGKCFECGGRGKYKQGKAEYLAPNIKQRKLLACPRCNGTGTLGGAYTANVFAFSLADIGEIWDGPMLSHTGTTIKGMTYDQVRARMLVTVSQTPYLNWLFLTKRPETWMDCLRVISREAHKWSYNAAAQIASAWLAGDPPKNIYMGTTVENQAFALRRIPELLQIPAALRFLSCEPLLGEVDLCNLELPDGRYMDALNGIVELPGRYRQRNATSVAWVIAGGESGGAQARPMNIRWARKLRDQCTQSHTLFHFKQWGEFAPPRPGRRREPLSQWTFDANTDREEIMCRVGVEEAGRELDGRTYDDRPLRTVAL